MGGVFTQRTRGDALAQLQSVLFSANPAATEAWFRGRSEEERKEVAAHCLRWFKKVHSHRFSFSEAPRPDFDVAASDDDAFQSALVAWFASTSAPSSLARYGWRGVPPAELVLAVVRDRKPVWIDLWVHVVAENVLTQWPLVRSLVTEGLCEVPQCDGYTLGMISHYSGFYNRQAKTEKDLRNDPALFDDEIWRIFRVEGNADASLSMARGWSEALLSLVEDGTLDRGRVVRETLEALNRDFAQHKAGFYSRFYRMLNATDAERELHCERFLGLLTSRVGPTQSLALAELRILNRSGRLGAKEFLNAASPALVAPSKGTTLKALQLVASFATSAPELAEQCCELALEGFDHRAPEVHAEIAALIETHANREWAEFAAKLRSRLGDVVASQRSRLELWLGEEDADTPVLDAIDWDGLAARAGLLAPQVQRRYGIDVLLQRPVESTAIPALPWLEQRHLRDLISPIANVDDLIALVAHVVEGGASADDVERALDGISRLCAKTPDDFALRSGPLRKRILGFFKTVHSFNWTGLEPDLWRVAQAWLDGAYDPAQREVPSTFAFWQHRALRIANRVSQRIPYVLLSTPTHSGGWIDPRIFVQRAMNKPDESLDTFDVVLGLLRLAPEHREEALLDAKTLPGELGAAVRHALGSNSEHVGGTASIWIAAARARDPEADDAKVLQKHAGLGPDAGRACSYECRIKRVTHDYVDGRSVERVLSEESEDDGYPTLVIARTPTVRLGADFDAFAPLLHVSDPGDLLGEHYVRWLATAWPAGRRAWFARGANALYNNMDWGGAEWQNHVYLDILFDYEQRFGEIPMLCLAVGLTAKEPREVALATDVLIAALEDGRVTGVMLGTTMRQLCHELHNRKYKWRPHRAKAARWAKTLGEAARVSPLHAEEVRIAIEHAIAFDSPADALKDQGELFSLLRELCALANCGVQNPTARTFLASYAGSSKAAKLAKACLACAGETSRHAEPARALALEARLRRVE